MRGFGSHAPIAIASAVALSAQALLGLLMLRLFSPQDVGRFTVVSQIGFFWMTLALVQSPLHLLANIHRAPRQLLQDALRASLALWLALLPLSAAAVWLGGLSMPLQSLAWAGLLALLQIGWHLAQAWTLRTAGVNAAAAVRAAPPLLAVVLACAAGLLWPTAGATGLFVAAAAGYGLGATWLRHSGARQLTAPAEPASRQADDRSTRLRLVHSLADASLGLSVLLLWQRWYGPGEASYLAVLLRVFGMLPALVHAAWPQVLLAQGRGRRGLSLWIGLGGATCVALLGMAVGIALEQQWLSPAWQALSAYIAPLVLWQGCACLFAAHAHLPFQRGQARQYTMASIGFEAVQLLVLLWPLSGADHDPQAHLWALSGVSAGGLLLLTGWMAGKK